MAAGWNGPPLTELHENVSNSRSSIDSARLHTPRGSAVDGKRLSGNERFVSVVIAPYRAGFRGGRHSIVGGPRLEDDGKCF